MFVFSDLSTLDSALIKTLLGRLVQSWSVSTAVTFMKYSVQMAYM